MRPLLEFGRLAMDPRTQHSSKIQRVCRSPGASEAAAAGNAGDAEFIARFQFGEMLGKYCNLN